MFSSELTAKAHDLLKILKKRERRICAAESCTGGLVSAILTEIPGSSSMFERGFITYSNHSKIELLTVPTFYIDEYGAVSLQTAVAMAEGALLLSKADISVAITGVAGPEGGSEEKPVGTVFVATAMKQKETKYARYLFDGSRPSIRNQAVNASLEMLLMRADEEK